MYHGQYQNFNMPRATLVNKLISAGLLFLVACLLLTPPVVASQKTELKLWKFHEFLYGTCGFCGDYVTLKEGKSLSSMTDFYLYLQDGYYEVSLMGSSGATITLFGANHYSTEQGFLVIIKRDDKIVSIEDLEAFAPDTWVKVGAKEGVTGAYSTYYHPFPRFKNNIRSGKWGHWWGDFSSLVKPAS